MIIMPPEIQHSKTSVPIPAMAAPSESTHLSLAIAPYTPSDASPTPPPLPSAPFMDEDTPSPPTSPTPRRPSAILTALDNLPSLPTYRTSNSDHNPLTNQPRPLSLSRSDGAIPSTASLQDQPPTSALIARLSAAAAREDTDDKRGPLRNPLDKFTKATMPQVHDAHPISILDHIDLTLVVKWEQCPGEKLLAQAFDYASLTADLLNGIRSRIFAATTEITQSQSIGVAAPVPSEEALKARRTPSAFLIYNLTPQHRELLLSRHVWASSNITFRVTPLSPICPDFLFTLRDLSTMLEQDIYELVHSVWHDEDSTEFLESITNSFPDEDHLHVTLSLRTFVASMYVTRLDIKGRGDAPAPRYNVYANGSTIHDDNTWCRIKAYFANRIYSSMLLGQATTQHTPYSCGLCHSVDHPRGLCPFPNIPGWNGPPLRPINATRRYGDN
jgi:hypothetical protein